MFQPTYKLIFEPEEDGGYHAFCPSIPGCHTHGDTPEEAMRNLQDALEGCLTVIEEKGQPIPGERLKNTCI